jgi:hypothetical protein
VKQEEVWQKKCKHTMQMQKSDAKAKKASIMQKNAI